MFMKFAHFVGLMLWIIIIIIII